MPDPRLQIVSEIRRLGKSNRGKELSLLQLSDDCLYQIYLQLKAGVSNRSIARLLQSRYGVARSENSIQQAVSLLAKRITPLLDSRNTGLPAAPITAPPGLSDIPADDALEMIDAIIKPYGNAIKNMVVAANCNDRMLTEDISKHAKALSALLTAQERLQRSRKRMPYSDFEENAEMERRSKLVLDKYVGNDGNKMIRSADKLLKALEEKCVKMELDDETGKYKPV